MAGPCYNFLVGLPTTSFLYGRGLEQPPATIITVHTADIL